MASAKLTCPECRTVLRPSKPVAPGKKVKCPKCETVFAAPAEEIDEVEEVEEIEEVEEVRPVKAASAKAAKKKEEKPVAKKADEEDDGTGTYGYVKEAEDTAAEKKSKKIRYGPDTSIKDPRGPATVKLANPASKLQLAGSVGAVTWLCFTLLIIFPAVFPINPLVRVVILNVPRASAGGGMQPTQEDKKEVVAAPAPPFFNVYGIDFNEIIELPWYLFMVALVPFVVLGCYSATIVSGGIKMQNLESRPLGFVAAALAILPLNTLGLNLIVAMVLQWASWLITDETGMGVLASLVINGIICLLSAGVGGWSIATLVDDEVIQGFDFVPE